MASRQIIVGGIGLFICLGLGMLIGLQTNKSDSLAGSSSSGVSLPSDPVLAENVKNAAWQLEKSKGIRWSTLENICAKYQGKADSDLKIKALITISTIYLREDALLGPGEITLDRVASEYFEFKPPQDWKPR